MVNPPLDRDARKQLVLTRIALERAQWTREVDAVQFAAQPKQLFPLLVRTAFGPGWVSQLFAGPAASARGAAAQGLASRLAQGLVLLRSYPVIWSLLGTAIPWLGARRGMRRVVLLAAVGTGVAAATWYLTTRRTRVR